jgi:hypothetical protein
MLGPPPPPPIPPSASGCHGAPPLDAQINLPFVLYCLMLSSWPSWPRWPSCCCVAVVMRLYTLSFQDFFCCVCVCWTSRVFIPNSFTSFYRLVWCVGFFVFFFFLCVILFYFFYFVDVVCPFSLSHPPHTFILRVPFIRALCSGRSFRSFFSFLRSVSFGVLLVPSTA